MKEYLEKLCAKTDLDRAQTEKAFDLIMSGQATPAQTAAFLMGLRMKGETVAEITAAAACMRRHAVFIDAGGLPVVDTCGTGGDGLNTFNISTSAAIVTAGAGVPVAKHGNRAMSSKCGSADVLAALGVNIEAPQHTVEDCIREAGIGFLFAPKMHPAMKHAGPVRKELGIRTIFNMLGPLTNPAGAKGQLLGVFASELTEPFAHVLRELGGKRAMVVHGRDGMDEITTTTTTRVTELKDGRVTTYELDPLRYIENPARPEQLAGGDPATNAAIIRGILEGKPGAARDIVCLNAAAAIFAGGKADNLKDGLKLAQESVDSGRAAKTLARLVEITTGRPV